MGDFGGWIERVFIPEGISSSKANKETKSNEAKAAATKQAKVQAKAESDAGALAATKKAAEDKRRASMQSSYGGSTLGSGQATTTRKILLGR